MSDQKFEWWWVRQTCGTLLPARVSKEKVWIFGLKAAYPLDVAKEYGWELVERINEPS